MVGTSQLATETLRSTDEIRRRAQALTEAARRGESSWFLVDDDRLAAAATVVAEVTRRRYPTLNIPFHSRWRHLEAGGIDRAAQLDLLAGQWLPRQRTRTQIDLAVISVLLDAGAGAEWHYSETATGQHFSRSEGLAVASFHAFADGLFSGVADDPLRVDAEGLRSLELADLATAFQVGPDTPLVGLDGRLSLLHRLADALEAHREVFGPEARPGYLFDYLLDRAVATGNDTEPTIAAHDILTALLTTLSEIWPAANVIDGVPIGDCWRHEAVVGEGSTSGWMPFHKLSQWLTYSLLEPFTWAGATVAGIDELTALPEYRNGGLLLDTGVLIPRSPTAVATTWQVGDEFIVEWRALTVALLDELAPLVRTELGVDADALPLACVLEGGTWAAGRELAAVSRGGLPPLRIASDGTVF